MRAPDAARYPLRGPNTESALAVGFALGFVIVAALRLGLIGLLLAAGPTILFVGYLGRIAERTLAGEQTIPAIRPLRPLVRRGLSLLVVILAYSVPPTLYTAWASTQLSALSITDYGGIDSYVFMGLATSMLLVWGLFGYLLPAAMLAVVRTGSLRAMLSPGELRPVIGDLAYLIGWLEVAMVVVLAIGLSAFLFAYGRVGGLLAIPILVYVSYIGVYMLTGATRENLW